MKHLLPVALLLALAACSSPAKETVAEAPKVDPTQAAVTGYLKKTLDDPASYQPAHWSKPMPWQQKDVDRLEAREASKKADISIYYMRKETDRSVRMIRMGASKTQMKPFDAHFNELEKEVKQFQRLEDSLLNSTNRTQLGTRITHAFRAKNKMGALVLDSAQFVVYKDGTVKPL